MRQGTLIASISSAPGKVYIRKSKYDLTVTCAKPGFTTATAHVHSGIAKETAYDSAALIYGPVGWVIDSATGADNKYDPVVTIGLEPLAPHP